MMVRHRLGDKEYKRIQANIRAKQQEENKLNPSKNTQKHYHKKLQIGFNLLKTHQNRTPADKGHPIKSSGPAIDEDDVPLMDRIERHREQGDDFYLDHQ